jgi:replicative DNA helicase
VAYLTELITSTPTAYHAESYAETLIRLATLRKLIDVAGQIAKTAYAANGESTAAILERVRKLVDDVTPVTSTDEVLLWLDSLERFVLGQLARNNAQAEAEAGQPRLLLSLPWERTLARFKVRLRRGTLALVVAGSSIGKTTFMECCAEWWAQQGHQVAFFHLELSHQMMLDRRMSRLTGIPIDELEGGVLDERTSAAYEKMRAYKGGITYVHCPGWSARQITAKARELHAKGLCDVLILDYFQKLRLWRPRGSSLNDGLADAGEVVKTCLEQLGIAGLGGSQTNRRADDANRVTASHIRGSGELDEKANLTITLDRDILLAPMNGGQYQAGERSPVLDVRIDKNTMGPTGECRLAIRGERFTITELATEGESRAG